MKIRLVSFDCEGACIFDNWPDVLKEINRYNGARKIMVFAPWREGMFVQVHILEKS